MHKKQKATEGKENIRMELFWKENNERRKALHYDEIFHKEREKDGREKQTDIKERLTNTETAISHKEFLIRVFL